MLQVQLLILLMLGALRYTQAARINTYAGPFSVVIHSFEQCEEDIWGDNILRFNGISVQSRNTSEHFFVGNLTSDRLVDQTFGATVNLASWDPVSGWRPNAFRMPFPDLIKALDTYLPSFWKDVKTLWGGTDYVPQGHYMGTFRLDRASDVRVFKNMIYGKYKVDLLVTKRSETKRTLGCLRLMISVVPKKNS